MFYYNFFFQDIKEFLDNSASGVIYFSLGTNVKSVDLAQNVKDIFLKVFSSLPYDVLWKFESEQLLGKPKNVKIVKFLPQQDILR